MNLNKEYLMYIGGGIVTNVICVYFGYRIGKQTGIDTKCYWCRKHDHSHTHTDTHVDTHTSESDIELSSKPIGICLL